MSGVRKRVWRSGNVTWEASWYDAYGKRHTANYDTRSEAEAGRSEMLRQRARGGTGDPTAGDMTLTYWHARWVAGRAVRPSTALREETIWRVHIAPALGDRRLASLRRSDIATWVLGLSAGGLAPSTVVRCAGVLHRLIQAGVEDDLLAANPVGRVRLPQVDPAERRFLSASELTRLEASMDPHWSLIVPFGAASGLRIGELSALRVRDLRLAAGEVQVRGTAVELSGRRTVSAPKSRAGLSTVPTVYPALQGRLATHIDQRRLSLDDWLFGGERGDPMPLTNWRNRV